MAPQTNRLKPTTGAQADSPLWHVLQLAHREMMRAAEWPREEFLAGPGGTGKNCWNSCACRTRITTSEQPVCFILNAAARPASMVHPLSHHARAVSHFWAGGRASERAPRRWHRPAPIAPSWDAWPRGAAVSERESAKAKARYIKSAQLFLSFPFAISRPRKCEQRQPAQCCCCCWKCGSTGWSERRREQEWLTRARHLKILLLLWWEKSLNGNGVCEWDRALKKNLAYDGANYSPNCNWTLLFYFSAITSKNMCISK